MRNALVLSMTTALAATAAGANSFETDPPAEKKAMSIPLKLSLVSSSTVYVSPAKSTLLPAERLLASSFRFLMGKFRSARTMRNSWPTAPVAPAMATLTDMTAPYLARKTQEAAEFNSVRCSTVRSQQSRALKQLRLARRLFHRWLLLSYSDLRK